MVVGTLFDNIAIWQYGRQIVFMVPVGLIRYCNLLV